MNNRFFSERDASKLWHPCTQMKDTESFPIVPIVRGEGVYLEDADGQRYIDAISSWWTCLFGHANSEISEAIKIQLNKLEHVMFAGFTHEPAIELAEKLIDISPAGLSRCYFAENGSSAVEIALKMSFHYWQNLGQNKKCKYINLSNSYHGETLGALSVGDMDIFKTTYQPLLMDVITVPTPDCFYRESGESWKSHTEKQFAYMLRALEQHAEETCAVILEPLIQGAGRMRMYDPCYLSMLRDACNKFDVHLIADEIAVGFGRTGEMFACDHAGISPDFLCLAKGITSGFLPLSAVLTTEKIYEAFYDDYETMRGFFHSHTYCGNPLACAAGVKTLELFSRDNVIENNKPLIKKMCEVSQPFNDLPHVAEVRQMGMVVAIELVQDKSNKTLYPWQDRVGYKIYQEALKKGVLLRPSGDVIYFIPPYVITPDEIEKVAEVAYETIMAICK